MKFQINFFSVDCMVDGPYSIVSFFAASEPPLFGKSTQSTPSLCEHCAALTFTLAGKVMLLWHVPKHLSLQRALASSKSVLKNYKINGHSVIIDDVLYLRSFFFDLYVKNIVLNGAVNFIFWNASTFAVHMETCVCLVSIQTHTGHHTPSCLGATISNTPRSCGPSTNEWILKVTNEFIDHLAHWISCHQRVGWSHHAGSHRSLR